MEKSIFVDVEYMEDESCKDCISFTSFKLLESVILVNDFFRNEKQRRRYYKLTDFEINIRI